VILLWRPSTQRLARLLTQLQDAPLTYRDVGITEAERTPAGYRRVSRRIELGRGREIFHKAGEAVLSWEVQRCSGLGVHAESPRAQTGEVVITTVPAGPLVVAVPCRVVQVTREENRIGFAYGTLPGHPASGEEAFMVEQQGEDVLFTVTAVSRPGGWLERIGTPVLRIVQSQVTERYLRSLQPVVEKV